jgi:hypothetical protein
VDFWLNSTVLALKNLAIFFLFPSKEFLLSAVGNFSPKKEGTKTKAAKC